MSPTEFTSIDQVEAALTQRRYIPDRALATTVFLALRLGDDWDGLEVRRLRDWVQDKLGQANSLLKV